MEENKNVEAEVVEEKASTNEQPAQNTADNDDQTRKILNTIGYFGLLFLLPLLIPVCKNDKFSRFHTNQSIALFIVVAAISIVCEILSIISGFMGALGLILSIPALIIMLGVLAFEIYALVTQIIALWHNEERQIPVIGKITILK